MKKVLKWIGIAVLGLVGLVGIYVAFIVLAKGDDAPFVDNGLKPDIPTLILTKENDAYYDFQNLTTDESDATSTDGSAPITTTILDKWDSKKAVAIIAKNQSALAALDASSTRQVYIDPTINLETTTGNDVLLGFRTQRAVVRIGIVQSRVLIEQGKTQEGFDELMKVVKLGSMMEKGRMTFIQYLVGLAIKRIGTDEMKIVLTSHKLDKAYLAQKSQELENYRDDGTALGEAFKVEYQMMSNTLPLVRTKCSSDRDSMWSLSSAGLFMSWTPGSMGKFDCLVANSYLYKPVQTQKLLAPIFSARVAKSKEVCSGTMADYEENTTDEVSSSGSYGPDSWLSLFKFYFTENAYGKTIVNEQNLAGYESIYKKLCLREKKIDELQSLMK